MKKTFAILGIIIGAFVVVGGILIGAGCAIGVRNNIDLFNDRVYLDFGWGELVKSDYKALEEFDSLYLDMNYGSVEIVAGDGYGIEYELYSDSIVCEVSGKKLTFKERRDRNFVMGLDFGWFGARKKGRVKVYVPEQKLDSVEINTDLGNININGMMCQSLNVDCDMGAVECKNVTADRVYIDADMGAVEFSGAVSQKIEADVDMGDVEITGYLDCDIDIDADMGSVDVVTYYSSRSYRCELDVDMGHKNIRDDGGMDSETTHSMDIDCDMGSISVTYRSAT